MLLQLSLHKMDFASVVRRCRQLHCSSSGGEECSMQPREAVGGTTSEVFGRICSSVDASPPVKLSTSASRKTVFAFGPDAIESIVLKMSTYDALLHLGMRTSYLHYEVIEKKYSTWLVLFKSSVFCDERGSLLVPATWDGVGDILRELYPGAYADFQQHLPELRQREFEYFEQQAGFSFLEARKNEGSTSPPFFYSYDYFCCLPQPRSSWQLRAFLYCELRLLEQFTGDGVTSHPDGHGPGPKEYLCPNSTLAELKATDVAVLPLTVIFPSQQSN